MQQDGSETQDASGAVLDAARLKLFGYFKTGTLPRWREPANDKGCERMDADVLRLSAMTVADLFEDAQAFATLLAIADYQGWS